MLFWIVSPAGSTFLYKRFIQPILKEREQVWIKKEVGNHKNIFFCKGNLRVNRCLHTSYRQSEMIFY
jgi:hypothetical protein